MQPPLAPFRRWRRLLLGWVLWAIVGSAWAYDGVPPLKRFTPDLEIFPQNRRVVQDGQGLVYVANANGVLIFDSQNWQLVRLPGSDIVRSLAWDGDQRVYVGGYGRFGYIAQDAFGIPQYTDLTPGIAQALGDRPLADIWNILAMSDAVYFVGIRDVIRYTPADGGLRLWPQSGLLGPIAQFQGLPTLQFRGEGLRQFRDGAWQILPGTSSLTEQARLMVTLPDGRLLALMRYGQWLTYDGNSVQALALPDGFPPASYFEGVAVLPNGSIALAGDGGQLYVFDPAQSRVHRFHVTRGAQADVSPAQDGGLFVLTDLAVIHVDWPSPWTVSDDDERLTGLVRGTAQWEGRDFVLTSTGAHERIQEDDGSWRFVKPLGWTQHEGWDLLPLDAQRALFAESYELRLVDSGGGVRVLSNNRLYPRHFWPSRFHPGRVYLGTEFGLGVLQVDGAEPEILLANHSSEPLDVVTLIERGPDEVWVGSEHGGVWRLTVAADGRSLTNAQSLGPADGLAYGTLADGQISTLWDGRILASTAAGLFVWDGLRFSSLSPDPLQGLRADQELLRFEAIPDGRWLAWSSRHVYLSGAASAGSQAGEIRLGPWSRMDLRGLLRGGLTSFSADPRGHWHFGMVDALLHYDASVPPAQAPQAAPLLLRAVERVQADGRREHLPLAPIPNGTSGDYMLRFQFVQPDYQPGERNRYQVRLDGMQAEYGPWDYATNYGYTRLEPGDYRLHVRVDGGDGRLQEMPPVSFSIRPQWYQTPWARLLWGVLGLLFLGTAILLTVLARTRKLRAATIRLEGLVAERTAQLAQANAQLHHLANTDGLTEIANRRRFDEYFADTWLRCADRGEPLALLLIDLDHFKTLNDTRGHLAADELLKQVGRVLRACLRGPEDLVARYGGDEFVVVLPNTGLSSAKAVGESMRCAILDLSMDITISVGVGCVLPTPDMPLYRVLHEADEALYASKRAGRNRVSAAA